jgi:hypothetical protein
MLETSANLFLTSANLFLTSANIFSIRCDFHFCVLFVIDSKSSKNHFRKSLMRSSFWLRATKLPNGDV